VQVYVNIHSPWFRLDLEAGETVTWKWSTAPISLVRLPERKPLSGVAGIGAEEDAAGRESGHDGHTFRKTSCLLRRIISIMWGAPCTVLGAERQHCSG